LDVKRESGRRMRKRNSKAFINMLYYTQLTTPRRISTRSPKITKSCFLFSPVPCCFVVRVTEIFQQVF
jgi:hypothetical protein